ncbi:hypothetical protein Fcan01_05756 [Folsomia candida]|uniref:BEN domain-containing protein n=1 Tax=Folsomia candida TaxID=158441 RepID=A0A226ETZ7_FOLCA|nr:hypothetical protein Fcan01_05756 [Folsomia candida]
MVPTGFQLGILCFQRVFNLAGYGSTATIFAVRSKKRKKQHTEATKVLQIDKILASQNLDQPQGNEEDNNENNPVSAPAEPNLDTDIDAQIDYKEKFLALKIKYRELRRKHKTLVRSVAETNEVELYPSSGVTLSAAELASIKLMSNQPTVRARNLFRRLFTLDELRTHSLLGKRCNANRNAIPLPAIDPNHCNAVIGYILKEEGVDGLPANDLSSADAKLFLKKKRTLKREITKSLSDFLLEETRKPFV